MGTSPGRLTLACRWICGPLAASPVLYDIGVRDGNPYLFLGLVLLAPVAGAVLLLNSLYCLIRYRKTETPWVSIAFMAIAMTAGGAAWYFLPKFAMH